MFPLILSTFLIGEVNMELVGARYILGNRSHVLCSGLEE